MWFTSAGSRHYAGVADGWQLWLPSLSYPRGNYINSRTYACSSACVHQQTTDKALITPRGVDWMNFTAEYSSFLPMCLTFVMITCLALDYHNTHLKVHYVWHLGLQFNLEYINAGGRNERKHSLNKTKHGFLLIFLYDRTLTWQASWIRWLFSLWASHWLLSTRGYSRDQAFAYGKKKLEFSLCLRFQDAQTSSAIFRVFVIKKKQFTICCALFFSNVPDEVVLYMTPSL